MAVRLVLIKSKSLPYHDLIGCAAPPLHNPSRLIIADGCF
jgi:hypothetical protein